MSGETDLIGVGMTSQRTRNRLTDRLRVQGIVDHHILGVIGSTPRHLFVDEALSHRAYEDTSLPIGFNQTISQPYIVARMTEVLLSEGPVDNVLEVGTGSGYQAVILAQLVKRVFTVERIGPLLEKAAARFRMLRLRNISYRHADGAVGWPERGPFDGIIVTASPRHIPQELVDQLAEGGRMVLPLGTDDGTGDTQNLVLVTRTSEGFVSEVLEPVHFVPLVKGKS